MLKTRRLFLKRRGKGSLFSFKAFTVNPFGNGFMGFALLGKQI
jgi:hypothetical protein